MSSIISNEFNSFNYKTPPSPPPSLPPQCARLSSAPVTWASGSRTKSKNYTFVLLQPAPLVAGASTTSRATILCSFASLNPSASREQALPIPNSRLSLSQMTLVNGRSSTTTERSMLLRSNAVGGIEPLALFYSP